LSQNTAISAGKVTGLHLNLKTLGIGNGLTVSFFFFPVLDSLLLTHQPTGP
jgi:hypothetical protein